jgi:hypothetical protein
MLVGYNTNIAYKGTVYHVQTEDSGIRNPHIITLLYDKGTILARKKTSYAHIANAPDFKEQVRELMKEQHKAMIKELIHGKLTASQEEPRQVPASPAAVSPAPAPEPASAEKPPAAEQNAKAQISRSLDDILLDYILREEDK